MRYNVSISFCQIFTVLSSLPDAIKFKVGWKIAQLTPLSCPSNIYLTSTFIIKKYLKINLAIFTTYTRRRKFHS